MHAQTISDNVFSSVNNEEVKEISLFPQYAPAVSIEDVTFNN
jgi:hypothetical protein